MEAKSKMSNNIIVTSFILVLDRLGVTRDPNNGNRHPNGIADFSASDIHELTKLHGGNKHEGIREST